MDDTIINVSWRVGKIGIVNRHCVALPGRQWSACLRTASLRWTAKGIWSQFHRTFESHRQVIGTRRISILARAALRSRDWSDEAVSIWCVWSLVVEGFILARAGVQRWRWDGHDIVVLPSLRRREEVGDEARHGVQVFVCRCFSVAATGATLEGR